MSADNAPYDKGREMKVWGSVEFVPGVRGQRRVIVAASAARAMGVSAYRFREWASETGNDEELEVARSKPGTAFHRPLDHRGSGGWCEVDGR